MSSSHFEWGEIDLFLFNIIIFSPSSPFLSVTLLLRYSGKNIKQKKMVCFLLIINPYRQSNI